MFSLKDKKLADNIISKIKKEKVNLKFMHVCGTHQDTLVKNGLDSLLKSCGIEIIQGPGCPVCVTTPKEIEEMLFIACSGKIVTTFGDMMNVPGEKKSLRSIKAEGYDVRTVYGIEDAVEIAIKNPDRDMLIACAYLHDIGTYIITKKGKIEEYGWKYYEVTGWSRIEYLMKAHPILSSYVLTNYEIPRREEIRRIVSTHMGHWYKQIPQPNTLYEYLMVEADYLCTRSKSLFEYEGKR